MSALNAWSLPAEPALPSYAAHRGRVVLVAGGRQGVGVSTLAALFALVSFAEEGEVLLLETGGHGVSHRMLGSRRPESPAPWGSDTREMLPTPVLPNLSVLSIDALEPRALARRVAQLRLRYAVTVIDGGSRLATAVDVAAAGIDQLLCVTTTDGIASAGAYAVIKALSARVPALPVGVLVNRAPHWAVNEVDQHMRRAVSQFLRRDIDLVGQVPVDECLRAGLRAGMALHEIAVGSPAALALYEVVQSLQSKQSSLSQTAFAPRTHHRRS